MLHTGLLLLGRSGGADGDSTVYLTGIGIDDRDMKILGHTET
jgi:hypothetical protein